LKTDNSSLRPKSADDPPRAQEESEIVSDTFDATDQEVAIVFSELVDDNTDNHFEAVSPCVDAEVDAPAAAAVAAGRDPTPPPSEPVETQLPVFDCN
jgi:hypothetical protein